MSKMRNPNGKQPPNRLNELRKNEGLTIQAFADRHHVNIESMKAYLYLRIPVPYDLAIQIANYYNVTLDWLFYKNSFMDERDLMSDILFSLTKVIKLRYENQIINKAR